MPSQRQQQGFSLVELSVVVAIIAVIAVMGLDTIATFVGRTAYQSTQDKMAVIKVALAKHRYVYGYLPCPADPNASPISAGYGKESRSASLGCNNAGALNSTLSSGNITNNSILFGDLPVRDLELPLSYMKDGYGSRLRYVVVSGLTTANNFASTADGIVIRTGQLESTCATVCQDVSAASYVVLSFGADKRGSSGGLPCVPSSSYANMIDSANCQFNSGASPSYSITTPTITPGIFYDSRYSTGSVAANHDDDIILWQSKGQL